MSNARSVVYCKTIVAGSLSFNALSPDISMSSIDESVLYCSAQVDRGLYPNKERKNGPDRKLELINFRDRNYERLDRVS